MLDTVQCENGEVQTDVRPILVNLKCIIIDLYSNYNSTSPINDFSDLIGKTKSSDFSLGEVVLIEKILTFLYSSILSH